MLNSSLDPQTTVAGLVRQHSECAEVFLRHQIDFCCRGELSLMAAAEAKSLSLEGLLKQLSQAIAERRGDAPANVSELSTPRLTAHIITKHHEYLRRVLPSVQTLAAKVSRVHGERNPKLREVERIVNELVGALLPHLDEEEERLFPLLGAGDARSAAVQEQLASMLEDHFAVGRLLKRLRAATDDFQPTEWACNSYKTLFTELEHLERDTFTHVHLENHVLRPRFVPESALIPLTGSGTQL